MLGGHLIGVSRKKRGHLGNRRCGKKQGIEKRKMRKWGGSINPSRHWGREVIEGLPARRTCEVFSKTSMGGEFRREIDCLS